MDSDSYQKRLWALWLTLPTLALHYWLSWDRLPERVPTKYDASDHAIAFASRGDALKILLGVLGFALVMITAIGYLIAYQRPERARVALVAMYVMIVVMWLVENRFVWSLAHG